METLISPSELRDAIERLLVLKQSGAELAWGPRIPALSDWITAELARLAEGPTDLAPAANPGTEPLNAVLHEWLAADAATYDCHSLKSSSSGFS